MAFLALAAALGLVVTGNSSGPRVARSAARAPSSGSALVCPRGITVGPDGALYGGTAYGGRSKLGALYRYRPGGAVEVLVQFIDVTERRTFEEQLQQMADHDPLTGCLNRRSFARSLEEHHARVRRYGADGALIVLDLDNFKAVNDTLGHHVGDQLIVAISEVLKGRIRKSDVLARLGGDEFALLLPSTSASGAEILAESLLEAIRTRAEPFAGPGREPVSASIGIALFDGSYAHPDEVLVAADDAMYAAKGGGRSRWARARP
jgi:diguanylate cyclase (GGDEF)-like protein